MDLHVETRGALDIARGQHLALVDGMNFLYRAEYGFPSRIRSRCGSDLTGLFGFLALLRKALQRCPVQLNRVLVVFDADAPLARRAIDSNYKASRQTPSPERRPPFRHLAGIKQALDYLGLTFYEDRYHEADDVIAGLVRQWRSQFEQLVLLSRDKDLYQLLDSGVHHYDSARGEKGLTKVDDVLDRFGVRPEQWPDYLALVGDRSDGLSGVRGIGPVTARAVLSDGRTLDDPMTQVSQQQRSEALRQRELHLLGVSTPLAVPTPSFIIPSELPSAAVTLEVLGAWDR